MIQTAQAATIKFGAATLDRVADADTTAPQAAVETAFEHVRAAGTKAADTLVGDLADDVDPTRLRLIALSACTVTIAATSAIVWRRRRARTEAEAEAAQTADDLSSYIEGVPGWDDPLRTAAKTA